MEIRELKPSELDKLLQLYRCLHEADDPLPDGKVVGEIWREIQSDRRHVIFGVFEDENYSGDMTHRPVVTHRLIPVL